MYLLDANVFIESKNRYYAFDTFPCFWEWLDIENKSDHVASIQLIYEELLKGNDDLKEWAKERQTSKWFLDNEDQQTQHLMGEISNWVMENKFKKAAKDEFLDCGDPWLIAKAKVIGATVVTQETGSDSINKVKIPNVCKALGIPYINTFKLLRDRNAIFTVGERRQ